MKRNLFFIETIGLSDKFGIGSYSTYLLPEIVRANFFSSIYKVRIGLSHKETLHVQKKDGITTITILFKKAHNLAPEGIDFFIHKQMAKQCISLLAKKNGDGKALVHVNITTQFELASGLKKIGFFIVYTHHFSLLGNREENLRVRSNPKNKINDHESKLLELADHIIFLSHKTKLDYQSLYSVPPGKVSVITNGVPIIADKLNIRQKANAKRSFGFSTRDIIYLFVGRITEEKGIFETVIAFKALAAEKRNLHLLIAGNGNLPAVMSISLEKTAHIHFLGYLSSDQLQKIYAIADIGVLVSYQEQSSFAVLELMNNDIPVILSKINAFSSFRNNIEVLKVDFKKHKTRKTNVNLISLYKAMLRLYNEKKLRNDLSKNAKKKIQIVQNAHTMTNKTVEIYGKFLSKE